MPADPMSARRYEGLRFAVLPFFLRKVRSFAFFEARKRKKEEENVFGEKVILCEGFVLFFQAFYRSGI